MAGKKKDKKRKHLDGWRKPDHFPDRFASVRQQLAALPLPTKGVLVEPPGVAKMSEILNEFVEPIRDAADTLDGLRRLFGFAVIAWNLSLMPDEVAQKELDRFLRDIADKQSRTDQLIARDLMNYLIERRRTVFAKYPRMITACDVTRTDDGGYYLSVASLLPPRDYEALQAAAPGKQQAEPAGAAEQPSEPMTSGGGHADH